MGSLHAAPLFLEMMMNIKNEWDTLAKERCLKFLHQKLLLIMCYCMGAQPSSS